MNRKKNFCNGNIGQIRCNLKPRGKRDSFKRPRDLPGPFKKVLGPSGSLGPVLPGPRDLQGLYVLSCPVPSRDLPGTSQDGTVLLESLVCMHTRGCQIGMQGPQLCAKPRYFCKLDVATSGMAFFDLNLHVLQFATSNSNNLGHPVMQNCTSDTP